MLSLLHHLILALVATLCSGYANPLPCSGICVNTHDPSLIRRSSDGLYYRFATGGKIPIFSATSVQGPWRQLGNVLSTNAKVNNAGNGDLWAPDVQKVGDTYVLFYSASQFGKPVSAIGYATSSTLDPGSWTDRGQVISSTSGSGYNSIDANLVNSNLLNFGSFWKGIYQVKLDSNYQPAGTPYQIAYNSTAGSGDALEGSYVFQHGSDWFLTFSSGQCCNIQSQRPRPGGEYKIMVCRASSPSGPFTDKNGKACTNGGGTILLQSHGTVYGPGGQGVLVDGSINYLYYHYMDTKIGYGDGQIQWGVNVINWAADGWPTV